MARRYVLGPNAARKVAALLRGSGEVSRRQGAAPGLAFDSEYVAPFTVQWAQSANDGDGSWIIWLPGSRLVMVGNNPLDPSSELDDVGGEYPEGWYILDDDMLDPDDGGTLYLNIAFTGGTYSATFADHAVSPSGQSGTAHQYINVRVCEATVEESGERKVEQFVTSAIVFWNGGDDDDTVYDCDGHSISRADYSGSDSSTLPGNYFYLNGFGKFTIGDSPMEHGFYDAPDVAEIEVDGEPTTFAAVCRTGNSSSPDMNFVAYKKLKIKSVGGSSPFAYEKSTTLSDGQLVTLHKLVNCKFYWNGELEELADYDVSGLLGGGTVYLRGTQAAPSSSSPDPTWTWTLGTAEQQAPTNGKALNYKLYDFAQSKVAVDYRTTFLALEDHTQKARFVVAKPNGTGSVILDASGETPKLVITNGTKSVAIDLADVASGNLSLCNLKYGTTELGKIIATADKTITPRQLVQGNGIQLTVNGNQITISATGGGSGGSGTSGYSTPSGSEDLSIAAIRYDTTSHQLQVKYHHDTFENGLLTSRTTDSSWSMMPGGQAVEETA